MSTTTTERTPSEPPERTRAHAHSTQRPQGATRTLAVLLRQRLRRDRWQLLIWILAIALLALFSAASIQNTYGDAKGRADLLTLAIANPAILMLRGLPQGSGLAAVTYFEIFTFLALLAGLMSTFLAVRHSRAEEETGRAELVASTPAARILPTVATLVHGVLANVVLAVAVALGFIASGLPVGGSFLAGAATGGVGVAFVAVGLLLAQLMMTSRGANGAAAALVVLAYVLRGIGDATGTVTGDGTHMVSSWPSWLSPIGWGEQTSAYVRDDWTPLLLDLALAVVLMVVVFALQSVRDSGAGLIPERPGRADARATLSGPLGLAWRLQWPTILGWTVGGLFTGLLAGALGSVVSSSVADDPALANIRSALGTIGSGGSGPLTQVFIAAIFSIVGVLAAACATQVAIRLRQEEAAGAAEVLMSTPLSRVRWLLQFLLVGVIAIVLVLAAAGLASGLSAVSAGESASIVNDSFAAAAAQLPVALVYLGVLVFVFVLAPRWTVPLAWTLLGLGAFVGIFGGLVGMPEWMRDLSPFTHVPVVVGTPDWTGGYWMFGIAVVATAGAALLIRRRDFAIG
ncbi:ABC transporter permease [Leifsonia sp. NPDC058292]|uniref:ABC transporter permease n=1 Tax=Leifsonia sp. NPDC058292 TaxID=3346428 RepID=UPI0036DE5A21